MKEYEQDPVTGLMPYDTIYHVESNGDLIKVGYRYMDPFCPYEYLIGKEPKYFEDYYGLTKAQVWNICHGLDKDQKHYCPNCGAELTFHGFSQGAFGTYCSRSCRQSYNLKNMWKDPDYREYTLSNSVHRFDSIIKRNYTEFLNQGELDDECFLYLAWTKSYNYDYVKFGASGMNIELKRKRDNYITTHKLFSGTRQEIADLEYNLSMHFKQEWFTPDKFQDFKSKLKELLNAGNN